MDELYSTICHTKLCSFSQITMQVYYFKFYIQSFCYIIYFILVFVLILFLCFCIILWNNAVNLPTTFPCVTMPLVIMERLSASVLSICLFICYSGSLSVCECRPFRSSALSFPGAKSPQRELLLLWNFRSSGANVPGTFVPRNIRSRGTNIPRNFAPKVQKHDNAYVH